MSSLFKIHSAISARPSTTTARVRFVFRFVAFHFRAVAGADENTLFHAGIPAAFQVNQLVADHETFREVQIKFIPRVEQKLRRRLAAAARLVGRFGRDVNFLEAHAVARELAGKMLVHAFRVGQREIAAPDAGLVGDDERA